MDRAEEERGTKSCPVCYSTAERTNKKAFFVLNAKTTSSNPRSRHKKVVNGAEMDFEGGRRKNTRSTR